MLKGTKLHSGRISKKGNFFDVCVKYLYLHIFLCKLIGGFIMRKITEIGKKALAVVMSICVTAGLFSGIEIGTNVQVVEAAPATGFTQYDFLKCNGTYIKNNYGQGSNVYLRGTNAGNWLVQESWMSSTSVRDQKNLMSALENRFGTSKMYELLDVYEDNYWVESDFDKCKTLGMSVIRLPFTYMNLYRYDSSVGDWVLRNDAFKRLDWFVEEAAERGIYVILDLHGAFGSQNGQDHSGEVIDNVSDVTFFSNDYYKNKTLELWRAVASHYAGNPAVAGYDTLNEPGEKAGSTNAKHWAFYDQMYDTIRSVDPDHIIIMESCWGTANLPHPANYGWTNVVYEYHHYTWDYVSNLDGQKTSCDNLLSSINGANYGVPTFIGEFTCFGIEEAWNYVLDKFNNAGWHYTTWSYKSRNSGSWGIFNEASQDVVYPSSDSESSIRTKWGASSIGTGSQSTSGMVYRVLYNNLPGVNVFADKALTSSDYFTIKANINNKYVCADKYGEANLIADRTSTGEWEQFKVIYNDDGTVSFQSRANSKYLCAVFDDDDTEVPVIPRSSAISTWEKFYVEKTSDGYYTLRTFVDNYYVQADINDTNSGILHACSPTVGTWELFTFEGDSNAIPKASGTVSNPSTGNTTSNSKYAKGFKAVAYYPNWYGDFTSKVQWDKLTHVNYSFALPNANGTLDSVAGSANVINKLISAAHANDVKVHLAVGGWSYSDGSLCQYVFESATNTDAKCQSLANSILSVVDQYGFDGVDIDWEYPTTSTATQYTNFMRYLRNGLDQRGMTMSVAVAATSGSGQTDEVLNMVDWVNVMAYDGNSGSGHSPYSLLTNSYNYWHNTRGVPASKVVLGVPFYERPNWASYADIVAANSANAYKDSAVINGTTVYYNGINTMAQKATYAAQNAGGIMIWEISQDTTNSSLSLMNAIYNAATSVLGEVEEEETTTTTTPPSSGTSPEEVFGVVASSPLENTINVVWGRNEAMETKGQTYNVYVDGVLKHNSVACGSYDVTGVTPGTHTVKVTSLYNGNESSGVSLEVSVAGIAQTEPETTTKAPEQAIVSTIPGTIAIDSYSAKSDAITIMTEGTTKYAGNLNDGTYLDYNIYVSEAGTYDVELKLAAGDVQYNAENVIIKVDDVQVASVDVKASSAWTTFLEHSVLIDFEKAGNHKLTIQTIGGACNVADVDVDKYVEDTSDITASVEINGYQISTTAEGFRTVYSVVDEDNQVAEVGLVYGLTAEVSKSDMFVGSTSDTVYSYVATNEGIASTNFSKNENATSYVMTMSFIDTVEFYQSGISIRAYIKTNDGRYVYTDVSEMSVYDIADNLYRNNKMNTYAAHKYLFERILSKVEPDYVAVDYNWNNTVVMPN